MNIFTVIAIFISVAAVASYINYRYIRLPSTIGLMLVGLMMSLCVIGLDALGFGIREAVENVIGQVDFGETLMKGMLSLLLFAGALKININDLRERKLAIGTLATGGVILTTFIVGTVLYYAIELIGIHLPYIFCLVFGALIAPTDPVAVMGILKTAKVPKSLEIKIAGESLFNDGIGVVVFMIMVAIATGGEAVSVGSIAILFLKEAVGGAIFGLVIGYITYRLLKNVNDYSVEVLLTLALVCGGYALALKLHTSGPIAIVVAGILIGNHGRSFAMSDKTRDHLDKFWELIDEILNAILFVWIGLEILVLSFTFDFLLAGLMAIPLVLLARFGSVWTILNSLRIFKRRYSQNATMILTWGGLRGGISIALALSLAYGEARDLIVSMTYIVVVFSILVQGLTIGRLIKRQ